MQHITRIKTNIIKSNIVMFQAAFIKRASRLASPAIGMAGIATAFAIVNNNNYEDNTKLSQRSVSNNDYVALCDSNKGSGSVVDMLNHIQEQVSICYVMRVPPIQLVSTYCNTSNK